MCLVPVILSMHGKYSRKWHCWGGDCGDEQHGELSAQWCGWTGQGEVSIFHHYCIYWCIQYWLWFPSRFLICSCYYTCTYNTTCPLITAVLVCCTITQVWILTGQQIDVFSVVIQLLTYTSKFQSQMLVINVWYLPAYKYSILCTSNSVCLVTHSLP